MGKKKIEPTIFDAGIGTEKGNEWSQEKLSALKIAANRHIKKRKPEQILENRLTGIRFRMQQYALNPTSGEAVSVETFVKSFLAELHMPLNRFAKAIGTTDSNLKKYLTGTRKLNPVLALKFGSFFRMSPELWMQVQLRNQMLELYAEKKQMAKYQRYDYENFVDPAEIIAKTALH